MNDRELAELFNSIISNTSKELEFRLYYDAEGNPIAYSSEDLPGNYLVVTQELYAEGRYDIKIIDGEIIPLSGFTYYNKIVPSDSGIACRADNALIVDPESDCTWGIKTYTQK